MDRRLLAQYEFEREAALELLNCPAQERPSLYRQTYLRLQEYLQTPSYQPRTEVELKKRLLGPYLESQTRFLEFGAGDGGLSLAVAGQVSRVWAVDILRPPLGETPPNFEFFSGDCLSVQRTDVDLVFSCHFVEHLHPDDLIRHLAQVHDMLGPTGAYICITPNRLLGPHDVSKHFGRKPSGLHLREYSFCDLGDLFKAAGYSKVSALQGTGRAPRVTPLWIYCLIEVLAEILPFDWRLRLANLLGREPFRHLEQVKILAIK